MIDFMISESVCAKSIERYVRTCGMQYLKGEHDGEYFCVANANGRRLHIHLEISPSFGDMLIIGVAPACSFRAADRCCCPSNVSHLLIIAARFLLCYSYSLLPVSCTM